MKLRIAYAFLILALLGCSDPLKESDLIGNWEYSRSALVEKINDGFGKEKSTASEPTIARGFSAGHYPVIELYENGEGKVRYTDGVEKDSNWSWYQKSFEVEIPGSLIVSHSWGIDKNVTSSNYFVINKYLYATYTDNSQHIWVYREYYKRIN